MTDRGALSHKHTHIPTTSLRGRSPGTDLEGNEKDPPKTFTLIEGKGLFFENLAFDMHAGPNLDRGIDGYKLIIHCGGCMINRQEMLGRIRATEQKDVPITNYGLAISHVHGVLRRALSPFPYELSLLDDAKERP